MKKFLFVLLFHAILFTLFPQNKPETVFVAGTEDEPLKFFPGTLLAAPFAANFLEPRMGFQFVTGENDLRLDIGASKDIVHYRAADGLTLSAGADFFTFTRLRGEDDFHFPVDAVDYLFGVNMALKKPLRGGHYGMRFRLSHISAHMVDGHYDPRNQVWRDGRKPIVYSREFLELLPFYRTGKFRLYGGFTWLFHVVPHNIGKIQGQAGFEYFDADVPTQFFVPFAAYDIKTVTLDKTTMNHSLMAGLRIGGGARIYFVFNSGQNLHGEYYDVPEHTTSIGFNLEF